MSEKIKRVFIHKFRIRSRFCSLSLFTATVAIILIIIILLLTVIIVTKYYLGKITLCHIFFVLEVMYMIRGKYRQGRITYKTTLKGNVVC
jgi:hypothetical protein